MRLCRVGLGILSAKRSGFSSAVVAAYGAAAPAAAEEAPAAAAGLMLVRMVRTYSGARRSRLQHAQLAAEMNAVGPTNNIAFDDMARYFLGK